MAGSDLLAAAQLDLVQAWNMSWSDGIQFIIVLIILYYVKKRIDLHFARKTAKNAKRVDRTCLASLDCSNLKINTYKSFGTLE